MYLLFFILSSMLLLSLCLVTFPFYQNNSIFSKRFLLLITSAIIFSSVLYFFSGDKMAVLEWLTYGEKHYQLLDEFQKLGGVDGAIVQIEKRLKENPDDAEGWTILSKLYASKGENKKALEANKKANALSGS